MSHAAPASQFFDSPEIPGGTTPVGYAALMHRHELRAVPHHRWTFLAERGGKRELPDGRVVLRFPHLAPSEMSDVDHFLFSLKHDGLSLAIFAAYLEQADGSHFKQDLEEALQAKPTGKYLRKLWFLYEWFTGEKLGIPDASQGNYGLLLDPSDYFTGPNRDSRRHRVRNNLLGNREFCPMVRRTTALQAGSTRELTDAMTHIISSYDPDLLGRAIASLYTKETMSSFAIERESPGVARADKFASLLKRVAEVADLGEQTLTRLQNSIVDPRYAEGGFRDIQNYVGESVGLHRQRVHYVPPRPGDVVSLMKGWHDCLRVGAAGVDAVVWAACLAFGFVYIHPFEDGNGRLHRFIIHYVLAKRGVTPPGLIAPVSAVMLAKRPEYDACLEEFSRPLMELLDYEMGPAQSLEVVGETANHYRYIDFTSAAEHLYRWLEEAVNKELPVELDFLLGMRDTRAAMSEVVDLPDKLANLFVQVCLNNGGTLSARKRDKYFDQLSDEEIADLEAAVRQFMPKPQA